MTPFRLLTAVLVLALLAPLAGAEPPPDRPLRLAFVDLTVVFRESAASEELSEEMVRLLRQSQSRMERVQREIASIRRSMEDYAMGTPERQAQEEKLNEKNRVARMLEMETRNQEQTMRSRFLVAIYDDAMEAIEEYARENDLDMVLKEQSLRGLHVEDEDQLPPNQEVVHQLSRRSVLFARPEYDITDKIVEAMNAAFERRQEKEAEEAETPAEGGEAP